MLLFLGAAHLLFTRPRIVSGGRSPLVVLSLIRSVPPSIPPEVKNGQECPNSPGACWSLEANYQDIALCSEESGAAGAFFTLGRRHLSFQSPAHL